jgi:pantetheine-phosphate adenylyltransferase
MIRVGLYSGSFDPLTHGHVDILLKAADLCDRLVVAIGVHPAKTPLFGADERAAMIGAACTEKAAAKGCLLEVTTFDDLAVAAAERAGASIIFRGLRDGADFDYEMAMAGMNAVLRPAVGTVLLPASSAVRHITATHVRQIAAMGGDVAPFVPGAVAEALKAKFARPI